MVKLTEEELQNPGPAPEAVESAPEFDPMEAMKDLDQATYLGDPMGPPGNYGNDPAPTPGVVKDKAFCDVEGMPDFKRGDKFMCKGVAFEIVGVDAEGLYAVPFKP
jgi:hypothetical protein